MEIIKELKGWQGRVLLFKHKDKFFVCSRANTFDRGDETMIFASDEKGNVEDWTDLFVKYRMTNEETIRLFCEQ